MRKLDNKAFTELVPLVLAVVITFAVLFVGAFVNGEIDSAMIDTYATNTASGTISYDYWHNNTRSGERNITLTTPATVNDITVSTVAITVYNTNASQAIRYNLTVNNVTVFINQSIAVSGNNQTTIATLIANGSLAVTDTWVKFNWTSNNTANTIHILLAGTYHSQSDYRSTIQNATFSRFDNTSENWDSALDIVQVVIIITILASAIGAIFLFNRFRQA